ncbi:hypothetical protein Psal006b_01386 [Piscirickettsia salmonis]|uniref:SAM-dependent methyltransferase n=1 Tax=Piscirickettsia salmonis TaxID=1238 RepID=A0A1L6TCB8_PISSA|nr:hypothetical protein [Piscirickettsia salmonis]AKP74128.1 hypothetical protein PSLF89_2451 [Piscirickettsia salmonis LF-89 = ATCC VR-1361]ALB23003.1 SAM-dependent methyltransferase [Piscirickettsia salmonis]ALY02948.1 hypothetical protein AWE47_08910 [Piscirickettsia salmonis]AMA42504.1 hypothetical protein AWJ11_09120 [Piscirickettsia salmonis]AOS34974.1 hypothetical protein AVM72_06260 [Piscirickettsia salmonis]
MPLASFLKKINPSKESGQCAIHCIQTAEILKGNQGIYTEILDLEGAFEVLSQLELTRLENWVDVKAYILKKPNTICILETEGHSWNAFSTIDGSYHHIDSNQGIYQTIDFDKNYEDSYIKKYQALFDDDDGARDTVTIRVFGRLHPTWHSGLQYQSIIYKPFIPLFQTANTTGHTQEEIEDCSREMSHFL